jgi:hypothetical protein
MIFSEFFHYFPRSIEEKWTYECMKNRCTRKFHRNINEERITLISCSMTCGSIKLWPKPYKADVEKSYKQFKLSDIQYQIMTEFSSVAELMHKTMAAFFEDLKQIVSSSGSVDDKDYFTNDVHLGNKTEVIISIHITESNETLLSLSTNECYSLSITCKI